MCLIIGLFDKKNLTLIEQNNNEPRAGINCNNRTFRKIKVNCYDFCLLSITK